MNSTKKESTINFKIDNKIYSIEAIIGAAYMFLDRAYLFLDSKSINSVDVSLKSKKQSTKTQLNNLKDEFLNELLFCSERLAVAKRNKKVREFVVGRALFSAIEEDEDKDNFNPDDPLGIKN